MQAYSKVREDSDDPCLLALVSGQMGVWVSKLGITEEGQAGGKVEGSGVGLPT